MSTGKRSFSDLKESREREGERETLTPNITLAVEVDSKVEEIESILPDRLTHHKGKAVRLSNRYGDVGRKYDGLPQRTS